MSCFTSIISHRGKGGQSRCSGERNGEDVGTLRMLEDKEEECSLAASKRSRCEEKQHLHIDHARYPKNALPRGLVPLPRHHQNQQNSNQILLLLYYFTLCLIFSLSCLSFTLSLSLSLSLLALPTGSLSTGSLCWLSLLAFYTGFLYWLSLPLSTGSQAASGDQGRGEVLRFYGILPDQLAVLGNTKAGL